MHLYKNKTISNYLGYTTENEMSMRRTFHSSFVFRRTNMNKNEHGS